MKYLSTLFILVLYAVSSHSQCPTEFTIQLKNQSDVDEYVQDFGTCTHLNELELSGNVVDISGLSALHKIDYLYINDCPLLTSLNGLHNLDSISNNLGIYNRTGFKFLCEWNKIKYIGQDLRLEGTKNIESLAGLKNVTFVGDDISIENNESLLSLDGLEYVLNIGDNSELTIANNPLLSDCCGVKNLLISQQSIEYNIVNNLSGCNSKEEIIGSECPAQNSPCTVSNSDINIKASNLFYPNPFQNSIQIMTGEVPITSISIYNNLGKLELYIQELNDFKGNLDLSGLKEGMYFILLKTKNNVQFQKLIKSN